MFRSAPQVSHRRIGEGAPCVVLDDVLEDPHALRALAARHREAFAPATGNGFPGVELPLPDAVVERCAEAFSRHARAALGARRVLSASGRLSMVTRQPRDLQPLQRVCHRDRLGASPEQCVGAAVLYLFEDAALGGTCFFKPRQAAEETEALMRHWAAIDRPRFERETGWPPAYMTQSNAFFERTGGVEARWNRLICYDGSVFHGSDIAQPARLSDDPGQGRLTLNLFFLCRRQAR